MTDFAVFFEALWKSESWPKPEPFPWQTMLAERARRRLARSHQPSYGERQDSLPRRGNLRARRDRKGRRPATPDAATHLVRCRSSHCGG